MKKDGILLLGNWKWDGILFLGNCKRGRIILHVKWNWIIVDNHMISSRWSKLSFALLSAMMAPSSIFSHINVWLQFSVLKYHGYIPCVIVAYDDVIKWKHFPFSLICVWINSWVNNHEAGDLRCYLAHYDVIVMQVQCIPVILLTHHALYFIESVVDFTHVLQYYFTDTLAVNYPSTT